MSRTCPALVSTLSLPCLRTRDKVDKVTDAQKVRSPSFPFISLPGAVHRARELYAAERRNLVSVDVAVAHWGYSPKSSGGKQTIAALKAYGLLEEIRGELRLTDRAQHIVVREPGSSERNELLRQAALSPPLFSKLWERYGADLPSDKSLRSYLVLDLKVNENSVEDLLRSYKETLEDAGLIPGEGSPSLPAREALPAAEPTRATPRELALSFPLGDNWGEFRILRRIRPQDVAKLQKLFEFWLDQIREESGAAAPPG